jgi:dienelactone hydrolase
MGIQQINLENHSLKPEKVTFIGEKGELAGYFFLPPGGGPFPCVIDNHGSALPPGATDRSHPQTAALFLSWGCAYLFPHRGGYGDSPGTPLAEAVPAARGTREHDHQMSERLKIENRDVIAALNFALTRPEIDEMRIVVMGSSLGGIHTLLALAADTRWRCGIDFSGGASQWAQHPKIKKMLLDAGTSLTQPIFLIQPKNDFNTAPTKELSALLTDRSHEHMAKIFPPWGTDGAEAHRFCAAGQQIWGPDVKKFLDEFL